MSLALTLLAGLVLTSTVGDPIEFSKTAGRYAGVILIVSFVIWNGWALYLMATNRTGILPGGSTQLILEQGPFRVSRNPLYLGLLALHAGIALVWPSTWALLTAPIDAALLHWGAIAPEERYLSHRFGAAYNAYRGRVRRWL